MKANFINILRKVTGTSIQKDISSNIVSTNQYSLTPEIIPKKERGKNNPAYYPVKDIWKTQCKLPPKTKRFCPLVLK